MKKRHKAFLFIVAVFAGLPLFLWLAWIFTTPRPVSVFIMDKSSAYTEQIRLRSINWVLNHYRFMKPNGRHYSAFLDYYGFHPQPGSGYRVRDLEDMTVSQIQQLSYQYQVAYYVNTYGVYDDFTGAAPEDFADDGFLYGGVHEHDLIFLEAMMDLNRLVFTEFVFFGSPTSAGVRQRAEDLMGLRWQGWSGRYFHNLSNTGWEVVVPDWMPVVYEKQYGSPWEFQGEGLVLIHEDGTLLVLEDDVHLEKAHPYIRTPEKERYGVHENIRYPGWFDVSLPTDEAAEVISWYDLGLNDRGAALFEQHNIPLRFPAVVKVRENAFYLAGDFAVSPVKRRFIKLKGARYMEMFLNDLNDPTDRSGFFLAYYVPLVSNILKAYHEEISF